MKRARSLSIAFAATLMGLSVVVVQPSWTVSAAETASECQNIAQPQVPGAVVESMTMVDKPAGTHQIPGGPAVPNVVAHCEVTLSLAHPGAGDHVKVAVWLPASGWNGRFQGTGGGGYAAGLFDRSLVPAIQQGYAAASTDAGVAFDPNSPATWALKSDGTVNTALLTNFASRSGHDMTVAAKQVVASFYGESASYSYWNGCSTGGRQGLMAAQRYPTDYDGIVAAAPAINWDRFIPSELWPQVVMNQEKNHPTSCEFNAFTQAAITACDSGEKVNGGIIDEPAKCGFDPRTLIGTKVVCDGETLTITAADAEVVRRIWQGPTLGGLPLWYGVPKGAPIDQLAGTTTAADGSSVGVPFPISDAWIRYFLKKQPSFDTATITYTQFAALFAQSQAEYNRIIGTDNPDLTAFRNANGKMITWHGSADPLIFSQGTENYYQRVRAATGGASRTDSFYRLFLAPGVGHCGLTSNGPIPTDALGAVVNWVEKGQAPATLPAAIVDSAGTPITRNLCPYPQVARYNGTGDPNSAANYQCAR